MKVLISFIIYLLTFIVGLYFSFSASFWYSFFWVIISLLLTAMLLGFYLNVAANESDFQKIKIGVLCVIAYIASCGFYLNHIDSKVAIFGERAEQRIAEEQRIEKDKEAYYREQMREIKAKRISEEVITSQLKDPKSALFRNQRGNCGEVNSKNSLGIMTGYQRFIVLGADKVVIENESGISTSEFNKIWASSCN